MQAFGQNILSKIIQKILFMYKNLFYSIRSFLTKEENLKLQFIITQLLPIFFYICIVVPKRVYCTIDDNYVTICIPKLKSQP